jgi:hypothetical protein
MRSIPSTCAPRFTRHASRIARPAFWAVLLAVLLTACSSIPTATPPPTATRGPTATPSPSPTQPPTASIPTATLTPIGQVKEPVPTISPTPVLTENPDSRRTPTTTAEPTDTPEPTANPTNVNPLTGLEVEDVSRLDRRPVAIKISNFPAVVRPQAGLSAADVVFEHEAEVQLTRFTAIFYGEGAEKVGPVRSARLIDLEIPAMFKAFFAFSGASPGVVQRIKKSDFSDRVLSPDPNWNTEGFRRIPQAGRAYEHTLYTDTPTLWEIADEEGWNGRQDLGGWTFAADPPGGGQPAAHLTLVYHPTYISTEYSYDAEVRGYRRSVQGEPHIDELTGEQLVADSVVVLYANHTLTDIVEDLTGAQPLYSTEIQLWGEGPMRLFRDGQVYEGRWLRAAREDLVRFVDAAGEPLSLKPGHTWIQFVRLDFEVEVE